MRAHVLAWLSCALLLALHATSAFAATPTPGAANQNLFSSPTVTETLTPSQTQTPSFTLTPTRTATPSSTGTVTSTPSVTATRTATGTITQTPTRTATITLTPTRTQTPTITQTRTRTATRTVTQTGTITQTPTITETPTVTPTRVVQVNIGTGTGLHGATIPITVNLVADGRQVAAAGNDITFNNTHLSWDITGCSANPALGKLISGGVVNVSGTSTTVRVFVLGAPLNTAPIADGPLYTCNFTILGSAPTGATTLTNSNPIAQDPDGVNLSPVTGANGSITVTLVGGQTPTPTPQTVRITLGSGSVGLNSSIAISASITTSSQQVAGAGNDLAYDNTALSLNLANCSANPTLGKLLETSVVGTFGTATVVRIRVVGAPISLDPIPDGALYTCLFTTNTKTGTYTLTGANYYATDPDGNPVTPATGLNGSVNIVSGFPTATRTMTPVPTATSIPTPLTHVYFRTDQTDLQQVRSRGAWSTSCYPTPGARLRMGPDKEGTPTALDCAGGYNVCVTNNSCTNGLSAATECLDRQACVQTTCRCGGDCNGDGKVTSTEINTATDIINGVQPLSACPAADISGDGTVRAAEITQMILNKDNGCPTAPACHPDQTCRAGKCHPLILCDSATSAATQCLSRQSCIQVPLGGGLAYACVCAGDCNNDGRVTGSDLALMTQIINGQAPLSACPAADPNGDGTLRAAEYTVAINNLNLGCP